MIIKIRSAEREALEDKVRILVYRQRDRALEAEHTVDGTTILRVEGLSPSELYTVRVFPERYRPVAGFARGEQEIVLHTPVKPESVKRISVYRLGALERMIASPGELEDEQLAGALNIWAKMEVTPLSEGVVSDYVSRISRINQDRIWFTPSPWLRTALTLSPLTEFRTAPAALHGFRGYKPIDSFKSDDICGNLQLTFLESTERPGELLVDADIDEASGIRHLFQVLRNTITGRLTHPYDVHQVLTFHQKIDPGYRLIV